MCNNFLFSAYSKFASFYFLYLMKKGYICHKRRCYEKKNGVNFVYYTFNEQLSEEFLNSTYF